MVMLILITNFCLPQVKTSKGVLTGKVEDAENKALLPGVTVVIKGTSLGATTDINGEYRIENLPVGNYAAIFSFIGFKTVTKTDIIIRAEKNTYLDVSLYSAAVELKSVEVRGGYFVNADAKPLSTIEFSSEEIRRAPGAAGDVSKILFSLPSVAKVNDGKSSLMVRGGSPVENTFFLDNMEIANINHFPLAGSTDGLIGLLNVDFVKDLTFYSGGFSPIYGDRLSSVMEINYREGDKNQYNGKLNLNYAGVGAQFEGPFADKKGTFFISANKSFLDLVMKTFSNDYPAPEYYDLQTKVTYKLSDEHKLSFIDLYANDIYDYDNAKAVKSELNYYGKQNSVTNTIGVNWLFLWGKAGYSNTSISSSYAKRDINLHETKSQNPFMINTSAENEIRFRNMNFIKFNENNKLEVGLEVKAGFNSFRYSFAEYENEYGQLVPGSTVKNDLNTLKGSFFGVYHLSLFDGLVFSPGARYDYFDYNKKSLVSPRVLVSYNLSSTTSLHASAGVFYQNIPSIVLAQSSLFKNLKTPRADHYVIGLSHLLTENTKLTIEAYRKNYKNFPVDPSRPKDFLFDEVVTTGLFTNHSQLESSGEAHSNGIEIMLQKKLAEDFYGMASVSYSKVEYRDQEGAWRERIYDNRFNAAIEGGYKPNNEWEFSVRWIYAGGAPYTPFDAARSSEQNKGILDLARINGSRLPDYHSMNIRADKRFFFDSTNLVVFLSIWNVYNRENVTSYSWNEIKNKQGKDTGWSLTPVFGVEYEF